MTKVISVLNQKGGAGKTTVSINLARSLQLDGYAVLLVDSDPQGSLRDWNASNDSVVIPVIGLDRETLAKDIDGVKSGYDFIIIDGAPSISGLAVAGIKAADFVLIPVQPSPLDIWACADLVDVIKARQEVTGGFPGASFVVSRAVKNTKLSNEITKALEDYELNVLKSFTSQRVIYAKSIIDGLTVLDFEKENGSAFKEIMLIKNEILEILK